MISIEDYLPELKPVMFDKPLISPREIQELLDEFRSQPKASHNPYNVLG